MTAREVAFAQLRWAALDEARRRETDALPTPKMHPKGHEVMASIGGDGP